MIRKSFAMTILALFFTIAHATTDCGAPVIDATKGVDSSPYQLRVVSIDKSGAQTLVADTGFSVAAGGRVPVIVTKETSYVSQIRTMKRLDHSGKEIVDTELVPGSVSSGITVCIKRDQLKPSQLHVELEIDRLVEMKELVTPQGKIELPHVIHFSVTQDFEIGHGEMITLPLRSRGDLYPDPALLLTLKAI